MKKASLGRTLAVLLLAFWTAGCGSFMARRMAQAPNTYPDWFAPPAPVLLDYSAGFLTNFPRQFATVGSPPAQLCYRVVDPAAYAFSVASTNWSEHGRLRTEFHFDARVPAPPNQWTLRPRGTVFLLHGYALAQFSMAPWALRLAQDGWRCVLVDLRGHGKSTGRQIYFGLAEVHDLSQLLDCLEREGQGQPPVVVMGESYGAALALRWQGGSPGCGRRWQLRPMRGFLIA